MILITNNNSLFLIIPAEFTDRPESVTTTKCIIYKRYSKHNSISKSFVQMHCNDCRYSIMLNCPN